MGCSCGAERRFWELGEGVYTTAVGYAGGITPNPTYEETCSGRTGHTEAVLVVFDPAKTSDEELLKRFWEGHDPTQGHRQGNDVGTQYRSAAFWADTEQRDAIERTRAAFGERLAAKGLGAITTEVGPAGPFFYAEGYHQQYLAKNPGGYCGLGGTGVSQNTRSAPQKQPMPTTSVSRPSGNGPFSGVPRTSCAGGTCISASRPGSASSGVGRRRFLGLSSCARSMLRG